MRLKFPLAYIFFLTVILSANSGFSEIKNKKVNKENSLKGWQYIADKLLKDGVKITLIRHIYLDKNVPPPGIIYFKPKPIEPNTIYSKFKNKELIQEALDFITKHKNIFNNAELKYKVSRNVITAIMLIETQFGKNTGNHIIVNRLSRVGSVAVPENVKANYEKLKKENSEITLTELEERARYLENRFYPEVLSLIKIAEKNKINILNIKGSFAGAFGIPQFLPSTYLSYAVDGNNDGKISLFQIPDAVYSIGNYLMHLGWKDGASQKEKENVIWEYNHSAPYIEAVLSIAKELEARSLSHNFEMTYRK